MKNLQKMLQKISNLLKKILIKYLKNLKTRKNAKKISNFSQKI